MIMTRKFSVAGIPFEVRLESPWKFMPYSAPVQQRIRKAAQGAVMDILPTRAGDDVPSRTYVTCREDLPENFDRSMLDFSQYEPFATEEDAEPVSVSM